MPHLSLVLVALASQTYDDFHTIIISLPMKICTENLLISDLGIELMLSRWPIASEMSSQHFPSRESFMHCYTVH